MKVVWLVGVFILLNGHSELDSESQHYSYVTKNLDRYLFNIYYINMIYEWDNDKNEYNKEKHDGISFEFAVRVFLDEKRIEKYDFNHSTDDEDRWNVIGMVDGILFVVYTERNDRTRIISARKATKEETDEYYDDYDFR